MKAETFWILGFGGSLCVLTRHVRDLDAKKGLGFRARIRVKGFSFSQV